MRYLVCVLVLVVSAFGATYYVDFENGSNTNTGTSAGSAWKHAPGDPAATGNANRTPAAGDVILFKGGVHYQGKLNINFNGASGNPIIYKGDGWGTEKAIIDCSEPVTGWTKCASAAEAGGNGNWAHIWYTTGVPAGVTALEANLFQGDSLLQCAQYPNLNDIFWMDDRSTYLTAASASRTALVSSDLAAIGSSITMGYVYLDRSGNDVDAARITSYNGSTTIGYSIANDPTGKFAIANVLSDVVMDVEGEYVADENAGKIYLWPWGGTDPNTVAITASVRQEVVQYNGSDHITFEGFKVVKSAGKVSYANENINLTIRNCDFHHCRSQGIDNTLDLVNQNGLTVDGCTFFRNARMRGVVARRSGSALANCKVTNCSFVKIGRTGVFLYEVDGGEISGNYIQDGRGVHSNGLSCYSDNAGTNPCRNVVVRDNISLNSNNCLTFYGVTNLEIVNNLFDGSGSDWPVSCWDSGNSLNVTFYHNNLVNSGTNRCGFFALPDGSAQMPTAIIKNNIIDGLPNYNATVSNNLYTMLAVKQVMGKPGDITQLNKNSIFTDWANGDWTLLAGSPAIDAGTDVGVTTDVAGATRPYGGAVDIGCYEWQGTGIGLPSNGDLKLGGLVLPNPVRALAGAIIIQRAILEQGKEAGLFTMAGHRVADFNSLKAGFYLLKDGEQRHKIILTD